MSSRDDRSGGGGSEAERRAAQACWSMTRRAYIGPPILGAARAGRAELHLTRGQGSHSGSRSGPTGAEMLGPVRSADEPEDGADERTECGRPYQSLRGIGFDDDHLTPVRSVGENLYERS